MRTFLTPATLNVDAYQAGHFTMIPPGMENFQCSQAVYRKPFLKDDYRIISAGMAPFIQLEMNKQITQEDIEEADWFYNDFNVPGVPYPWPKGIFQRIVNFFDGYMPIVITGLLDGQTHYVGEPHAQVWTDVPGMGELVGWIESTMLPYLWTSSVVATRGRIRKERMMEVFQRCYPDKTSDEIHDMVQYKFHDFGRRGAANSQITGIAHLINWLGTDTMDAAYAATKFLNNGKKFGACSIPAAARRTITPWVTENSAISNMIGKYKGNVFSVVADSYNYKRGMEMLSGYADVVKAAGGFLVGRPDSGDPVDCILTGLEILSKGFGISEKTNALGGRIITGAAIIQGDGVDDSDIFDQIYPAMIAAKWCPSNCAFGMGQHNHKAVRSDLEAAYKTCVVGSPGISYRAVMKGSESRFKMSIPCAVSVDAKENSSSFARVREAGIEQLKKGNTGDLVVHYDGRHNKLPIEKESFEATRLRAYRSWLDHKEITPEDTFAAAIRDKQREYMRTHVS